MVKLLLLIIIISSNIVLNYCNIDYTLSWSNNGPNILPSRVAYSCIVSTENDIIYLFGGRIEGSSTTYRNWTLKWDSRNSLSWIILSEESPLPFFCYAQNIIYNSNNKLIYIIVPTSSFGEIHDRIYIFNTSCDKYIFNHTYTIPSIPYDLDYSCSAIDINNNLIYTFGQSIDNHLQIFNITNNKWINNTLILQSPQTNDNHIGSSACYVYDNYFYSFGGGEGVGQSSTDKSYKYNLLTNQWYTLNNLPETRQYSTAVFVQYLNNTPIILIIGGSGGTPATYYNNYVAFDVITETYINISDDNTNSWSNNNYAYNMPIFINNSIIIWGGFNQDSYTSTNFENESVIGYINTLSPTLFPTNNPSINPTQIPITLSPTTNQPTNQPTSQPTNNPTDNPTNNPTDNPTDNPTSQPTPVPITPGNPTTSPSNPTNYPTDNPTSQPTSQPSSQPTNQPTTQPSRNPTDQPTSQPTNQPTLQPSDNPTDQPTNQPTKQPTTSNPTTNTPTTSIPTTNTPTSDIPTTSTPITNIPSLYPTSSIPTNIPTILPTISTNDGQAIDTTLNTNIYDTENSLINTDNNNISDILMIIIILLLTFILICCLIILFRKIQKYIKLRDNFQNNNNEYNQKAIDIAISHNQYISASIAEDNKHPIMGVADISQPRRTSILNEIEGGLLSLPQKQIVDTSSDDDVIDDELLNDNTFHVTPGANDIITPQPPARKDKQQQQQQQQQQPQPPQIRLSEFKRNQLKQKQKQNDNIINSNINTAQGIENKMNDEDDYDDQQQQSQSQSQSFEVLGNDDTNR